MNCNYFPYIAISIYCAIILGTLSYVLLSIAFLKGMIFCIKSKLMVFVKKKKKITKGTRLHPWMHFKNKNIMDKFSIIWSLISDSDIQI